MKPPLFTKEQMIEYIESRGYAADYDNMYDWYVKTEFCYVQGKLRILLVNWKNDINMKLRTGKFNAKKKSDQFVCIVDNKPASIYHLDSKGRRVYLCPACIKAIGGVNWGRLRKGDIERLVEQNKAKNAKREPQPEQPSTSDMQNKARALFNSVKIKS
jgi:hypothetical protein